jgi:hypothetical protein
MQCGDQRDREEHAGDTGDLFAREAATELKVSGEVRVSDAAVRLESLLASDSRSAAGSRSSSA